jgi:hypothetical protein
VQTPTAGALDDDDFLAEPYLDELDADEVFAVYEHWAVEYFDVARMLCPPDLRSWEEIRVESPSRPPSTSSRAAKRSRTSTAHGRVSEYLTRYLRRDAGCERRGSP